VYSGVRTEQVCRFLGCVWSGRSRLVESPLAISLWIGGRWMVETVISSAGLETDSGLSIHR